MFLPGRNAEQEKAEQKKVLKKLEGWVTELIPEAFRADCTVSVQEVQCGDPNCAPIDTLITLIFQRYVVFFLREDAGRTELAQHFNEHVVIFHDFRRLMYVSWTLAINITVEVREFLLYPWKPRTWFKKN